MCNLFKLAPAAQNCMFLPGSRRVMNSAVAPIVNDVMENSKVANRVRETTGRRFMEGLEGYLVLLVDAFTASNMEELYEERAAEFGMLGDTWLIVSRYIQDGDIRLLTAGLLAGGIYRKHNTSRARDSYAAAATLLGSHEQSHEFFSDLAIFSPQTVEMLTFVRERMNLISPLETNLYVSTIDGFLYN